MFAARRKAGLAFGLVAVLLLASGLPVTSGQDETVTAVEFTPYESNPILSVGEEGAWDELTVGEPRVIYHDGLFHMFYMGAHGQPSSILGAGVGYATSEDGLHWTPYEGNPVFVPDASVSPRGVYSEITIFDGETWVMFFTPFLTSVPSPAYQVLRATAQEPTGPWTVGPEPIFARSLAGDWDYGELTIESVLKMDDEYVLYYGVSPTGRGWFGRATSPDTRAWIKYNDPTTTQTYQANSDPVFQKGKSGSWDDYSLCCPTVYVGEHGWEMFYTGDDLSMRAGSRIGFAISEDGLTWTRFGETPVLQVSDMQIYVSSVVVAEGTYYLYYTQWDSENAGQIGVATGMVTWE
jgi:predicted GH43/DUF377 family glycosyl hydrolase